MASNSTINLVMRAKKILRVRQVAKANVELEKLAVEGLQSSQAKGSIAWLNE
jgi:hypothetical protein